jgi:iron complex outermembrane receptor protein
VKNSWCLSFGAVLWSMASVAMSQAAPPPGIEEDMGGGDPLKRLMRMSLEELSNVEVTSVSKTAQTLSSAPASIYVITREEILRAGAQSVPEALRLAPNLQVTQLSSTDYEIGARGFGSNREAQNFSNKILILIDGRSVYNPLFSGVSYDALDLLMDDVDRIEVISGPGATLWGSNAMNGVINIITRRAEDTQGNLLHVTMGEQEAALAVRHGGTFGGGAFRAYAKAFDRGPSEIAGQSAGDRWKRVQGGIRSDFQRGDSLFTVQGDLQHATLNKGALPEVEFDQFNVLGRWEQQGERVNTRLQLYFDRTDRGHPPSGVAFDLDSYDVDFQQSMGLGSRHQLVWGIGRRYNEIDIENTATLFFEPSSRTLELTNLFAQDTMRLNDELKLTAGIKFERNSYSGWSTLPDLRLSWAPDEQTLIWAAGAQAVRAPTPFDVDVRETFGGPLLLSGNPDFKTEKVWAYELGYRAQPDSRISWSASAFYNEYDDLRSVEATAVTFFPLWWDNLIEGSTYGVEIWGNWQVNPWWRLSPGFRSLHKRLRFSEGATAILDLNQAGNDPTSQGSLKSAMNFGRFSVDAMLRYVGKLPSPAARDYTELSTRIAFQASEKLEVSLSGFNLLDDTHLEYAAPTGNGIRRTIQAELRVIF